MIVCTLKTFEIRGGVLLSKEPMWTFYVNDVTHNNSYVRLLAVAYLGGRSLGHDPHLAY